MRKYWWIGLVLLVAVGGGLLYAKYSHFSSGSAQVQQENETGIQGAVARAGDLTLVVSGSGELVPLAEINLGFQDEGELVELKVQAGDQVQEGDILAVLQIDQTAAELASDLAAANLEVLQVQQALDRLYENAQVATAQALLAFEEAQQEVETLKNDEQEIALALQALRQAEDAVQEAERNLYIVNSTPSQQAINTAYASLMFKKRDLLEIQDQISKVEYQFKSSHDPLVRDRLDLQLKNLRVQLANQQIGYENALYKYENMNNPPDEIELSVAEARLRTAKAQQAQAQVDWQDAQNGPPAGDLAMAESLLEEAQADWERLKNGPDTADIELLEAQLAKAEAKLEMLQAGQLLIELVAPMDGIVLSTNVAAGDRIGGQSVLTLGDVSQMMVEVYLDEADSTAVQVGDRVEVIFDALPETAFAGNVVQVDPSLVRAGNTQALHAFVQLDPQSNELIKLPLGLNAGVDIIVGETINAILVSVDALYQDEDGGYFVYVIDGQAIEQRPVEVGLVDATTVEILSGLQAGEQVALEDQDFDQEQGYDN